MSNINSKKLNSSINRSPEIINLQQQVRKSANCFFIIAGLAVAASLIQFLIRGSNVFVSLLILTFSFIAPTIISAVAGVSPDFGNPRVSNAIAEGHLQMTVFIALIFIIIGFVARWQRSGVFLLGIILYALDTLLFSPLAIFIMPLSLLFHIFMLALLWQGFSASRKIYKL